jgi:hypothetical protein
MSLSEMLEGWKNNLLPKEEMKTLIEAVHSERIAICEACEFHSKNHLSIRPDVHCTNCGCTLAAKTRCLSCSCPINKWEKK